VALRNEKPKKGKDEIADIVMMTEERSVNTESKHNYIFFSS
jgi:hypothetical protein